MPSSESDDLKRDVSCVVLGLLAVAGPQTSYELQQNVSISIGFFWEFPRSQLYSEPQRLEEEGLVESSVEAGGRRRRTYAITEAGRSALRRWLRHGSVTAQHRDTAALKLFFSAADPGIVEDLARARVAADDEKLRHLTQPGLGGDDPTFRRVIAWGINQARADRDFWLSLLPTPDNDRS